VVSRKEYAIFGGAGRLTVLTGWPWITLAKSVVSLAIPQAMEDFSKT
jgi:hypothetical protein